MRIEGIPFQFARSGMRLLHVPWEHRYFNPGKTPFPQGAGRYDDEGVTGAAREGRVMDGPVVNAGILSTRLDAYVVSGEQVYLDLAIRHAERLALIGYESGGALYYPYMYEWNLHAFKQFDMEVPWFSGMAQGYILGCFSRLYDVTGNERYLELAHKTFNSFLRLPAVDGFWTTQLIDGAYLWFEEYARNNGPSDRAFNGHIYATWGLHDYWLSTRDGRAEALVDGGLTSLLHFLDRWRSPGAQSFYCLTHRERTATYHSVHTEQLAYLYSITGEPIFLQIADVFIDDYPITVFPRPQNPAIHVEPGTYTFSRRDGLVEENRVDVTVDEAIDITWDVRGVMRGYRNAAARSDEDPYRNIWFTDIPFKVWTAGKVDAIAWHQPLALTPNRDWDGVLYTYDVGTDRLVPVEQGVGLQTPLESYERAKLNGLHCYHITGGSADGLWIARDHVGIVPGSDR